jgi:alanine dehydrogenase
MISSPSSPSSAATPTPLEQELLTMATSRRVVLGIASGAAQGERRFPVTPEGTARLTELGFTVRIEPDSGAPIHYTDAAYTRCGAEITPRTELLQSADVVIALAPLSAAEAARMRRGALLLTLLHSVLHSPIDLVRTLSRQGITTVALERITSAEGSGNRIFADTLHEIDGCASIAISSALLTDPVHGKGILLGGVTGIVPCEVTILGSGMGAIAAAHNALGLGATVRMFDNDLYSLRQASRTLQHRAITSALHPHVVESALRGADVVIATPLATPFAVDSELTRQMKRRVLVFDLNQQPGNTFPALPLCNLANVAQREEAARADRICYYNVGCQVPRTAAMALSNALVATAPSLTDAVATATPAIPATLRSGALTLWGKPIDAEVAAMLGTKPFDMNLLTNSN